MVRIEPTTARGGEPVRVTITGYCPNAAVTAVLDPVPGAPEVPVFSSRQLTDSNGNATFTGTVSPELEPGPHRVSVVHESDPDRPRCTSFGAGADLDVVA